MLNGCGAGAGVWHELATFLPLLARKGIDALALQEATGLERSTQNIWAVASQVLLLLERPHKSADTATVIITKIKTEGKSYQHLSQSNLWPRNVRDAHSPGFLMLGTAARRVQAAQRHEHHQVFRQCRERSWRCPCQIPVIQNMQALREGHVDRLVRQVYESLKASGELPEATLAYFDADGAEHLLYELRFLAVDKRVEPAMYIVANALDVKVRQWHTPMLYMHVWVLAALHSRSVCAVTSGRRMLHV